MNFIKKYFQKNTQPSINDLMNATYIPNATELPIAEQVRLREGVYQLRENLPVFLRNRSRMNKWYIVKNAPEFWDCQPIEWAQGRWQFLHEPGLEIRYDRFDEIDSFFLMFDRISGEINLDRIPPPVPGEAYVMRGGLKTSKCLRAKRAKSKCIRRKNKNKTKSVKAFRLKVLEDI
jgi:hypothetical protein